MDPSRRTTDAHHESKGFADAFVDPELERAKSTRTNADSRRITWRDPFRSWRRTGFVVFQYLSDSDKP
jgi:hypothetical protein